MKSLLRLFLAGALLLPVVLSAATFEGKLTMKMTSGKDQSQNIAYSIKGDKVRVDMPSQKGMGGMIMDTAKREMLIMMSDQKMYMTMALPDAAKQAIEERNSKVQLEKTSETEKILGYTATKYISTYEDTKTDLWLAEGLGTFTGFNQNPMGRRGGAGASQPAWERALAGKELFPLRAVGHDKGGKETFRMEVTSIEKQTLPDSLFTPPADYQKFDMGGMMKGMMGK